MNPAAAKSFSAPSFTGAASEPLYTAHHPRLMFTSDELPALIQKVRDGGYDDGAYANARYLLTDVYPTWTEEEMLEHDFGIGEFPALGVAAFLETPPDTAAINLGRHLTLYIANEYGPDNNVFYSPLRLRSLTLGYDMFFEDATESERAAVRGEMECYMDTMLTTRVYEYWKYRPFLSNISMMIASSLGLSAICLVGETDPARVNAAIAMADEYILEWLQYQLDPDGSYKEGAMYAGWCMRHLCYYFWARKRYDGFDYSTVPGIRNMEKWVAYSLLPFGDAQINNVNDAASLNHPYSRHHTYFGWAQTEWNSGLSLWLWERLRGPTYGFDSGRLADPASTVLWGQNITPVHPSEVLPDHFLWEDRGLYYYRTGWQTAMTSDDVVFSFYSGKFHGGHSQEDQNNFTLYGFGTRFAIDHGYGMPGRDSEAHNMVFVDGDGQHFSRGSVGTDGEIAEYLLGDFADYLFGDATAAYDTCSEFNLPGNPFPEIDWSFGYDGGNPVNYAFRRFVVAHDPDTRPYFILLDDVEKDGSPHTYEWRMQTDEDNTIDITANPIRISSGSGWMDLHVVSPDSVLRELKALDNLHDDPDATVISLSVADTDPDFSFLMLPANAATPQPVYTHENVPWGEVFLLRWPGGITDLFIRNRSEETITYSPDTTIVNGPRLISAPAASLSLQEIVTDARFALIRYVGADVSKHLLSQVTTLVVDGKTFVEVNDGSINASLAGEVVEVDRASTNFRFYAPGANKVTFREQSLPITVEDGYLIRQPSGTGEMPPPPGTLRVHTYPNPFNATTTIEVFAESSTHLDVSIYDTNGRLVKRVWNGAAPTGHKSLIWRGKNEGGNEVATGVYLVKVTSPKGAKTTKIVLIK